MDEKKDEKTMDPLLEAKKDNTQKKLKTETFSEEMVNVVKQTSSRVCSRKFLMNRLPILTWILGYNLEMLVCDTIAGVTTALTVIPQGIGYAPLAGLPLQYGLYCSIVPGFVYCLFGTIRFRKSIIFKMSGEHQVRCIFHWLSTRYKHLLSHHCIWYQ